MPITMDGLSSGLKTDETVKKLKDVEEKKLVQIYDLPINQIKYQTEALKELRKMALELQKSLESLYNFDSPFEKKMVEASPEGFIEGVANKIADFGKHSLTVKNLADKLSIASKGISPDQKLDASNITINGKKSSFPGGDVESLKNFLNSSYPDLLNAKTVQKTSEESILVLESKTPGRKGELNLSDSSQIFKKLELIRDPVAEKKTTAVGKKGNNAPREDYVPVPFLLDHLSVVREGPTSFGEGQKSMMLGGDASRRLELDAEDKAGQQIKAISFEVEAKLKQQAPKEADTTPESLSEGPVNTVNVKGIIINSYNIVREREKAPEANPAEEAYDFGISMPTGTQSLKNNGTLVNIPLSNLPRYIDFYTHNKEVVFRNLQLIYSGLEEKKEDPEKSQTKKDDVETARQKAIFPHLIRPAQDAKLNIDGVDIERDKNSDLTDVIDGATLSLKKPTSDPVDITINPNIKKSREMVTDFIKKYNDLLDFTRTVSSGVKNNSEGETVALTKDEAARKPLITSSLVRSMITGLQTKISNAYPATLDPKIKILQMLGIGTGKPNTNWQQISEMHLQFEDDDLFAKMVSKYPEAVKEFFGQDKNGDRSFDDGLAFLMVEYLKAYTSAQKKGIIQSQIVSNEDRVKDLEKNKEIKQASIDEYEKKLKMKFGHMESVIHDQKSTGNFLRQKFGDDK
ncbi:MAG: flagellar filament capping protein FliD [Spirochaetia bacterium]|nr:flagellar filament capping protein FliD [Spirochaetia bacterium]